jgi:F0F1-type ATP synthase gamma subunit
MIIVIASDKGLAGAFNANVLKAYVTNLRNPMMQITWRTRPSP